jgi:hypothetical protein
MIRVTFSTQQQVTVSIICNKAGLHKYYFPNDFINFFVIVGSKMLQVSYITHPYSCSCSDPEFWQVRVAIILPATLGLYIYWNLPIIVYWEIFEFRC